MTTSATRNMRVTYLVLLALAIAAPMLGLYPVFGMKLLCFALFACAFNLLLGFTGLLSFGHAAFFGFAAYCSGWLIKAQGWSPELGLLAGMAVGGGLGLLFGLIAIRRQGIYFAMVTLGLARMVYFVCLQAPFTGGEDGMQGVPRGSLFSMLPLDKDLTLYYVVLAIFVACFLFLGRVVTSPFGQVPKIIRPDHPRTNPPGPSRSLPPGPTPFPGGRAPGTNPRPPLHPGKIFQSPPRRARERNCFPAQGYPHPHPSAVDPDANPDCRDSPCRFDLATVGRHELDDAQCGADGSLRVVLVSHRDAEVGTDAIALVSRGPTWCAAACAGHESGRIAAG